MCLSNNLVIDLMSGVVYHVNIFFIVENAVLMICVIWEMGYFYLYGGANGNDKDGFFEIVFALTWILILTPLYETH